MQLPQSKVHIRARSAWEAIDLGFAMVQTWRLTIYLPWLIFLSLFAILVWLVTPNNNVWLATLIFWWCKPIYDRLLLHILSQELFSLPPTHYTISQVWKILRGNGLLSSLTYRRFSASRGFNLAIWQLEKLKGKALKKRQRLLHRYTHNQAVWLTIACIHIEIILNITFFAMIFLWLPSHSQIDFLSQVFLESALSDRFVWIEPFSYIFYVLAVLLIEPFYMAASFALYLNRRIQLEAWDIELSFRNMGQRLAQSQADKMHHKNPASTLISMLILLGLLLVPIINPPVLLAEEVLSDTVLPATEAKRVITELMQTDELSHTKTFEFWSLKSLETNESDLGFLETLIAAIAKLFAIVFESLLWIILAFALIGLFITRHRWLVLFKWQLPSSQVSTRPDILFGMDIRPESLPDNIVATAEKLWQQGQQRAAFSLLYRAALMQLVNQDDVPLTNSHTEGDILSLSQAYLQPTRHAYLQQLTYNWQSIAYAHQFPSQAEVRYLLQHWNSDFDNQSAVVGELS